MYKAMDIAQYIINYAIELDKPVSNLKLQKLLYYVQAALLLNDEEFSIIENIYNWRHGPVIEEVYREYKRYGNRPITNVQEGYSDFSFDENFEYVHRDYVLREQIELIREEDIEIIEEVVDSLIRYSPWELVDRTHKEKPWKDTETNDLITKENIKNYFIKEEHRIYGE